jgi:hypothetical protein
MFTHRHYLDKPGWGLMLHRERRGEGEELHNLAAVDYFKVVSEIRWQQGMCKVLDWSNKPLHYCSKCCIKSAQMCLIGLLIHFQVQNCALSSKNNMVFFHCYCKLYSAVRLTGISAFWPYQICLCPGKSSCYFKRHANHISSTPLWGHRSHRGFKVVTEMAHIPYIVHKYDYFS